jgi:hypothetical protein
MSRRAPTAEQKAKAAERRERFRALAKTVAEMTNAERAALVDRCGAVVTIEGHPLSFFNTCLLLSQNPGASVVGGFAQWIKAGWAVRKGERGLGIWVPVGKSKGDGTPAAAAGGQPADADGNDDTGRPRFIMGTVFDIAQTDEVEVAAAVAV